MSDQRQDGISWTDQTWNPIRGCSRVSEGCRNCYAERMAARFAGPGQPFEGLARMGTDGPRWTGDVRLVDEHLADPLRWKRSRRVFVNSVSDLFHDGLTNEQIAAVFGVMAAAPQHTFQVLTKRPARMLEWFQWAEQAMAGRYRVPAIIGHAAAYIVGTVGTNADSDLLHKCANAMAGGNDWPLPNVWLGVSVENQAAADERIRLLLQTPAAVRFLSCEPLLGPVQLGVGRHFFDHGIGTKARNGDWEADDSYANCDPRIDWVIAGGESGPGARPMHPDWVRGMRDQCQAAGVPFHFKQWGDWGPHTVYTMRSKEHAGQLVAATIISSTDRKREGTVRHYAYSADAVDEPGAVETMERVGKKAAGRLLDGRTWDEFPGQEAQVLA